MFTQTIKVIVLLLSILLVLTYSFQRQLIYFPNPQKPLLIDFEAGDMKDVSLHTKDNLTLNSWYKPAATNKPTVLFLHGNGGNIGYRMPIARQFINAGFGVLLLEYRGYGGNKGHPTEQGLYEDGETALHFLEQQGVSPAKLALYGESLGSGVATKLATKNSYCALILQSPFTSLTDTAHYHYPWLPLKPWDQYNSLDRIKSIHSPLLIMHGTDDHLVPYEEGLTLFNAGLQPKKMLTYKGYDHNNLPAANGFYHEIVGFIQQHCT